SLVALLTRGGSPSPRRTADVPSATPPGSRELQALYATAVAIGTGAELESTATRTLEVICGVARADLGMVYRVEQSGGPLRLVSRERRRVDADELTLLQAAAHQLGLAVGRAALIGELQRKSRRLEMLTRVGGRLAATLPHAELLERVTDVAREMFDAAVARLWLVDDDGVTLSVRASAGVDVGGGAERMRVGEGLVGRVVATRAALAIADLSSDVPLINAESLRARGLAAFAGVPLLVGDRVLGALALGLREPHEYSAAELAVFASLANAAAVALENARLLSSERTRREH